MTFPSLACLRLPSTALQRLWPLMSITVLSMIGTGLVYVCSLLPAKDRLNEAEQAYARAKQVQTDVQRTKVRQIHAQNAQQQLGRERRALPSQEDFTPLALALSELGKRERVTIPGMTYDIKKPEGAQPVKATIAFRASGDYASIYRFLHRLETAEPYLVIERLDVAREEKHDASAARVVVNIAVATYLRQTVRAGTS